jgi:hypothetical protein
MCAAPRGYSNPELILGSEILAADSTVVHAGIAHWYLAVGEPNAGLLNAMSCGMNVLTFVSPILERIPK